MHRYSGSHISLKLDNVYLKSQRNVTSVTHCPIKQERCLVSWQRSLHFFPLCPWTDVHMFYITSALTTICCSSKKSPNIDSVILFFGSSWILELPGPGEKLRNCSFWIDAASHMAKGHGDQRSSAGRVQRHGGKQQSYIWKSPGCTNTNKT